MDQSQLEGLSLQFLLESLGGGPRMSISDKFPGGVRAPGTISTPGEPRSENHRLAPVLLQRGL